MSYKLLGMLDDLLLKRSIKTVLGILCRIADDVANQPGVGINAYPSIPTVAWKTDYSERQIQRDLRILEAEGIIVPKRIHPEYGTTEYEIHLERAPVKIPIESKIKRQGGGRNDLRRGDMVSALGVTKCRAEERHKVAPRGDVKSAIGAPPDALRGDKNREKGVTQLCHPTVPTVLTVLKEGTHALDDSNFETSSSASLSRDGTDDDKRIGADDDDKQIGAIAERFKIPLDQASAAFYIAVARHYAADLRDAVEVVGARKPKPIRSLKFFEPVVQEVQSEWPLPHGYTDYAKRKAIYVRQAAYERMKARVLAQP